MNGLGHMTKMAAMALNSKFVYHPTIQTSSLKLLGQSKPNYAEHRLKEGMKVYINGQGRMLKMATMGIHSKNL